MFTEKRHLSSSFNTLTHTHTTHTNKQRLRQTPKYKDRHTNTQTDRHMHIHREYLNTSGADIYLWNADEPM